MGLKVPVTPLRPPKQEIIQFKKPRLHTAAPKHRYAKPKPWDERFSVPISEQNTKSHSFFKTYFDKKPK